MASEREIIRVRPGCGFVLEGLDSPGMTLGEIRDEVAELITKYGETAIIQTEASGSCENCESDLDDVELIARVWIEREETDAELAQRHKIEAQRAADTEAHARREYERLRARFEPKPAAPSPIVGGLSEDEHAEVCAALDVKP